MLRKLGVVPGPALRAIGPSCRDLRPYPRTAVRRRVGAVHVRAHHPVVSAESAQRAARTQLRFADAITAFAGSMPFIYLHVVVFGVWMLLCEAAPWPTLTLVVSLEAIFLTAFVMIGQNRQAAFQQAKADHDFVAQELELQTNTEITRAIHALTGELHRRLIDEADDGRGHPEGPPGRPRPGLTG